jgi:hypothetical protein
MVWLEFTGKYCEKILLPALFLFSANGKALQLNYYFSKKCKDFGCAKSAYPQDVLVGGLAKVRKKRRCLAAHELQAAMERQPLRIVSRPDVEKIQTQGKFN